MITTVTRKHRHEMEQAVSDLLQRGFKVIYGPAERKSVTTSRDCYSYSRGGYQALNKGTASCWIAKLERVDEL